VELKGAVVEGIEDMCGRMRMVGLVRALCWHRRAELRGRNRGRKADSIDGGGIVSF
jgi:hypothetical protein